MPMQIFLGVKEVYYGIVQVENTMKMSVRQQFFFWAISTSLLEGGLRRKEGYRLSNMVHSGRKNSPR